MANSASWAAIINAKVGAAEKNEKQIEMGDLGEDSDEERKARDRLLGVVGSHQLVRNTYTIPIRSRSVQSLQGST